MEKIIKILKTINKKLKGEIDYARSIGIKVENNCKFYKGIVWESKPYLIEIDNNVKIIADCKFVTHDGELWVLRNLYNNKNMNKFGKIKIGNNIHIG